MLERVRPEPDAIGIARPVQHVVVEAVDDGRIAGVGAVVWRGDAVVRLTPIEYKLLLVFVNNPGRVLTHAELLRDVWGSAYHGRLHYVRIHMAHLRLKLEELPAQPKLFLTETGIGYRFNRPDDAR